VTGFGDIQPAVLALVWCDYAQYETVFVLYDSFSLYPMQRGFLENCHPIGGKP
jgi:hypothetical protein